MDSSSISLDEKSMAELLGEVFSKEELERGARAAGFLRRLRTLSPVGLVCALMTALGGCGQVNWIADIHRAYNELTGSKMRYKPFHNQLSKPAFAEWMRQLLEMALTHFSVQVLEPISSSKLSRFKDIVIHDGSSFALNDSLKKFFAGRFTKISAAAVELHVTLSALFGIPCTIWMAADKESERHFRPEPSELSGCLFLADRGYEAMRYLLELFSNGVSYVIRGKKNIRPTILDVFDENGIRSRGLRNRLQGKKLSWNIIPRQSVDLLVSWTQNNITYYGRIAVVYRAGPRNRKEFTYLHTNLPFHEFTHAEVGHIYRLRWQVELLFKEWKSYANLHGFETSKQPIAEGLIWASIMTAVVKRIVAYGVERSRRVEISTQRTAASAPLYFKKLLVAIWEGSVRVLVRELRAVYDFLAENARRAHPKRDRGKGRLNMGLQPVGVA